MIKRGNVKMFHDLLIQIILLVITVTVPWVANEVIKFVKAKSKNEDFKHFLDLATMAVKAAEEKIGSGNGMEKKEEVERYLAGKIRGVTVEDIEKIIDATVNSVYNMDRGKM